MDRKASVSGVVLLLLVAGMIATEFVNSPYPLSGDATRGTRGGTRGGSTAPPPQQQLLVLPQPSCVDGIKNGVETDADCGGPTCPKCVAGKACISGNDCSSTLCQAGVCQSAPATASCTDGVKNGAESGVDCGGNCAKCSNGATCSQNSDCQSSNCISGICQSLPSCNDGIKNSAETGVDCGGSTCPKCSNGVTCVANSDCSSNRCVSGMCAAACVANQGSSCNCNQCGSCGGTTQCDGSCSGGVPALPSGYGNSCNCNTGTIQCNGQCNGGGCNSAQTCQNNQCVNKCTGDMYYSTDLKYTRDLLVDWQWRGGSGGGCSPVYMSSSVPNYWKCGSGDAWVSTQGNGFGLATLHNCNPNQNVVVTRSECNINGGFFVPSRSGPHWGGYLWTECNLGAAPSSLKVGGQGSDYEWSTDQMRAQGYYQCCYP